MIDQCLAGAAIAGDDIDDAIRQPRLAAEFGKGERRQGRVFGGLQHHGVAGGQGRRDLPGQHQKGKVPRNDLATDA